MVSEWEKVKGSVENLRKVEKMSMWDKAEYYDLDNEEKFVIVPEEEE